MPLSSLSLSHSLSLSLGRWVVNTVGFYNRKFFVLFLFYTCCACCWVIVTSLPTLMALRKPGAMRLLERQLGPNRFMVCTMSTVLDCALIVMLSCFMPFHVRMVLLNETTIEGPSPEFHAGMRRNWMQVMGKDPYTWMLPVYGGGPDGDGVHWPSPLVTWAGDDAVLPAEYYSAEEEQRPRGGREEGRLLAGSSGRGGAIVSDSSDGE